MLQDVYGVPVRERWLVFSPLRNLAALVNAGAARLLGGVGAASGDGVLAELARELQRPCEPPVPRSGPASPPFLGLVLTRECNMGCRYCDFAAGDAGMAMSPALVSQAVTGWVQWLRDLGRDDLDLHFFGGEPFCEPDLIEIAVHRARRLAAEHGLSVRVEASTNGLLGSRMVEFVRDHFGALVLSLDGEAAEHDRHRPLRSGAGSFEEVWRAALALADSEVKLCIRCCVSDANVERMAQTAHWLCRALRPDTITFEPLKPTPEADAAGLAPPGPLAFARGFVAARRLCEASGVACVHAALYDRPRFTFCPVGQDAFIVAPDRTVRSCYLRRQDWEARGLDLRIGEVLKSGELRIDPGAVERLRGAAAGRARCARCFCRWSCAGGCLVAETPPGHDLAYTEACRRTRLLQACVLLDGMGLAGEVDGLLADAQAASALWEHGDDRLSGGRS